MTCEVSWLALERYHLGELSSAEHEALREHLDTCPACRRNLKLIEDDTRPLPSLSAPPRRRWPLVVAGGLAIAALALLVIVPRPHDDVPGPRRRVKGGDLVVSVVRERDGHVKVDPEGFRSGDRFVARVTCPPSARVRQVDIREPGSPPWVLAENVACGNQVVVGDPFVLTGAEPLAICAVLREELATVCRVLESLDK